MLLLNRLLNRLKMEPFRFEYLHHQNHHQEQQYRQDGTD
jgi:hypothetical protein